MLIETVAQFVELPNCAAPQMARNIIRM